MTSLENQSTSGSENDPRLAKIQADILLIRDLLKTLKLSDILGRKMFNRDAEKFVQDYIKRNSLEQFLKDFSNPKS